MAIDRIADRYAAGRIEQGEGEALQQVDLGVTDVQVGLDRRNQQRDHLPVQKGDHAEQQE